MALRKIGVYFLKYSIKGCKAFIDSLYPKSCPMCDAVIGREQEICDKCIKRIKYIEEPKCKKCGKMLESEREEYCFDCLRKTHFYDRGLAAFLYDDMVSHSIYRFKYKNRRTYAKFYGRAIAIKYGAEIKSWNGNVIIPVPIHKKKMRKRGYNQAELIALELGGVLHIPVDTSYLVRSFYTLPQKELAKSERKKNVENAFKIVNSVVKYKKIILVDDIYTTGSTIDACAKMLKNAGALEVNYISLSIGEGI